MPTNFVLHEDFPQAASSYSDSSSRQCYRTNEPNNSIEHSAIQKDSVHCTVAAVDISSLLFTTDCSGSYCNSRNSKWTVFSILSSMANYNNFIIFKLIIKPNSLLLEDQRSETSSQGYNSADVLFLQFVVTKYFVPFCVVQFHQTNVVSKCFYLLETSFRKRRKYLFWMSAVGWYRSKLTVDK